MLYAAMVVIGETASCFLQNDIVTNRASIEPVLDKELTVSLGFILTDQVFEGLLEYIQPGISEAEIRNRMEQLFKDKGIGPAEFGGVIAS